MSLDSSQMRISTLFSLILRATGILTSRTKLQKIAYLLDRVGWNVLKDYRYHYYGPYSDQITLEIENFRSRGWLNEEIHGSGERAVYSYALTRTGERIADALAARIGDPRFIQRSMGIVRALNAFSIRDLELMATLVFLYEEHSFRDEHLVRTVMELKPHFNEDEVRGGMRIFNMLASWRQEGQNVVR